MILQWLKSLVSAPASAPGPVSAPPSPFATPAAIQPAPAEAEPTPTEIAYVERCWAGFQASGLSWTDGVPRLSARDWAARTLESIGVQGGPATAGENRITALSPHPPLTVLWLVDDDGGERFFANAIIAEDHVYDGASGDDLRDVIAEIATIAAADWQPEDIAVSGPVEYGSPYGVTLGAGAGRAAFKLTHDKDFDWSLVERLNESLPATVARRFGWLGDGGSALIVFLLPAQIRQLGELCGIEFHIPGPQAS